MLTPLFKFQWSDGRNIPIQGALCLPQYYCDLGSSPPQKCSSRSHGTVGGDAADKYRVNCRWSKLIWFDSMEGNLLWQFCEIAYRRQHETFAPYRSTGKWHGYVNCWPFLTLVAKLTSYQIIHTIPACWSASLASVLMYATLSSSDAFLMTTTIYFKLQMDMLITRSEDREQKRKHPLTAQVRISTALL